MSRLQLLTTKFENMKMREDGTIFKFNVPLCDIASNSFYFCEKISDDKLVRKILRSLQRDLT